VYSAVVNGPTQFSVTKPRVVPPPSTPVFDTPVFAIMALGPLDLFLGIVLSLKEGSASSTRTWAVAKTDFTRDNGVGDHIMRHSSDVENIVRVSANCDRDTVTSNCIGYSPTGRQNGNWEPSIVKPCPKLNSWDLYKIRDGLMSDVSINLTVAITPAFSEICGVTTNLTSDGV